VAVSGVGAFLDWGLPKDVMVPFREQKARIEEEADGFFAENGKSGALADLGHVREWLIREPTSNLQLPIREDASV
jgi:hypothetical protein